jgi:uncharacterized protein (DUF433 family)
MNTPLIQRDKEILSGTTVFYGTRVPIKNLFDYIETGETIEDFLRDFSTVTKEQAIGVLELASDYFESEKYEDFAR